MKVVGTLDLLPKVCWDLDAAQQLLFYEEEELKRDAVFWWGVFYVELVSSSIEELSWQFLSQYSLVLTVVDNLSDCAFLVRFTSQAHSSFLDRNHPVVISKGYQPCIASEVETRVLHGNTTAWYHLVLDYKDRLFLCDVLRDVSTHRLVSKCFVVFDLFSREVLSYEMTGLPGGHNNYLSTITGMVVS